MSDDPEFTAYVVLDHYDSPPSDMDDSDDSGGDGGTRDLATSKPSDLSLQLVKLIGNPLNGEYLLSEPTAECAADESVPMSAFVSTPSGGGSAVNVRQWSVEETAAWANDVIPSLGGKFTESGINGEELLDLKKEDLLDPEFGLNDRRARKLLRAREQLLVQGQVEASVATCFASFPGQFDLVEVPLVRFAQLSQLQKIGEGHFGEVHRGVFHSQKGHRRDVVLKKPKRPAGVPQEVEVRRRRSDTTETMCLAILEAAGGHPNVVQFVGIVLDAPGAAGPCQVMSLHAHGSLHDYMHVHSDELRATWASEPRVLFELIYGITAGLAFLHEHGLVHGDLKTDNVLLSHDLRPRIADLGLSRKAAGEWPRGSLLPLARFPPEFYLYRQFSATGDMWMLGLMVLDLVRRRPVHPFAGSANAQLRQQIQDGGKILAVPIRPVVSMVFGDDREREASILERFIGKCLSLYPSSRFPSAAEALQFLETEAHVGHPRAAASGECGNTTAAAPDDDGFAILSASYGEDRTFADVADALRAVVRENGGPAKRILRLHYNTALGGDPLPGVRKRLVVRYLANGDEHQAEFFENDPIEFTAVDQRLHAHSSGLLVTKARYGAGLSWVDVPTKLQALLEVHHGSIPSFPYNSIFTDPCHGTPKVLRVEFVLGDTVGTRTFRENQSIAFDTNDAEVTVESAEYGKHGTWKDVTDKLRALLQAYGGAAVGINYNRVFSDPLPNVFKALRVRFRVAGEQDVRNVQFDENDDIVFTTFSVAQHFAHVVTIESAQYGAEGHTFKDVTEHLQAAVDAAGGIVQESHNVLFGDPAPGIVKKLVVEFRAADGELRTVEFGENARIAFTAADDNVARVIVRSARYGAGDNFTDVTKPLQAELDRAHGRLVRSHNDIFGDPLPNVFKALHVEYELHGRVHQVELAENETHQFTSPPPAVLQRAEYGADDTFVDVSHVMRALLVAHGGSVPGFAYNERFGDPLPGVRKQLVLTYERLGITKELRTWENEPVSLHQ